MIKPSHPFVVWWMTFADRVLMGHHTPGELRVYRLKCRIGWEAAIKHAIRVANNMAGDAETPGGKGAAETIAARLREALPGAEED